MLVKDVMNVPVYAVEANEPVRKASDLMREHNIRHLPVIDEGKVAGVFSASDLKGVVAMIDWFGLSRDQYEEYLDQPLKNLMKTRFAVNDGMVSVVQDVPLAEALEMMIDHKLTALPVLSQEEGPVIGMLSYIDVLLAMKVVLERAS